MGTREAKITPTGSAGSFSEATVEFESQDRSVILAGTLAVPSENSESPVVVLVPGTGPVDRDATFVGHALFRELAHSLVRSGIASLRFDKRGVGDSTGDFPSASTADFVADIHGAVHYLCENGFDSRSIGLIGHSEGGVVALTSAVNGPSLAFCVLLGSPFLTGKDNFVRSFALLAQGNFERKKVYHGHLADLTRLVEGARSTKEGQEVDVQLTSIADKIAPHIFNKRTEVILGACNLSGSEFLSLLSSACLETCLSWDPQAIVAQVSCPVLGVYAAKDVQVPARENVAAARELIARLGKKNWAIQEFGDMNHLFQLCKTGMPDEYVSIDHVMADEVLHEIAVWIDSRLHT